MDAEETLHRAENLAEDQKKAGAGRLDQVAKAVHGAADELGEAMPKAADFVHAAAARLEQGAGALRNRDMRQLANDLNDYGRRDPLALFGGAMLAGFAASRLLKSAAKAPSRPSEARSRSWSPSRWSC